MDKNQWMSHGSLYLSAIGAAFGLGNFWRFSYVVAENGGGAFVFIFLILLFLVGLPILTIELIFGKVTGQSVVIGFRKLIKNKKWSWIGWLPFFLCSSILIYYSIVSGWVLHFVLQFLRESLLFDDKPKLMDFSALSQQPFMQLALVSMHVIIVSLMLMRKVRQDLEKIIKWMSPLALLILIGLLYQLIQLPEREELLKFLFYPNFTELKNSSWLSALGHVFFSMSVGVGMMVTYGSYIKSEVHLPTFAFRISIIDAFVSLAAVTMVIGIAMGLGTTDFKTPGLLFLVLPPYFMQLDFGVIWGFAFFLTLYLVSLLASIGLVEVLLSNLCGVFDIPRGKAVAYIFFGATILCGLLLFLNHFLNGSESSVFLFLDNLLIDYLLPIVGVTMAWFCRRILPRIDLRKTFINEELVESMSLYNEWRWMIKFGIPIILIAFILLRFF